MLLGMNLCLIVGDPEYDGDCWHYHGTQYQHVVILRLPGKMLLLDLSWESVTLFVDSDYDGTFDHYLIQGNDLNP